MHLRTLLKATAGLAVGVIVMAGCSSNSSTGSSSSSGGGKVGLDQPRSDSDFWNAYAKYVPQKAKSLNVDLMPVTNSENDNSKLAANVQTLVAQGAKAVVMAPQDTGAVISTVKTLNSKNIPVVTVDTRPDSGKVYMTVRADNKAYGTKACDFLGQQLVSMQANSNFVFGSDGLALGHSRDYPLLGKRHYHHRRAITPAFGC